MPIQRKPSSGFFSNPFKYESATLEEISISEADPNSIACVGYVLFIDCTGKTILSE
jgi:hypothetical protein